MNDQNIVNETLRNIFSEAGLIDVICSLYERQLTSAEISEFLNLDNATIERNLEQLTNMNLIKKIFYNGKESYAVTNPKLCDSILMLKDAIYRINTSANIADRTLISRKENN